MKQNRIIFHFVILFIIISFIIGIFASGISSSAASPCFVKNYKTLTVGKSIQYQVKNIKKNYSVTYSVSNSSLASIQSKSGKLVAKKAGKITVKATICNKKGQKLYQIKDTILIENKYLQNASFQIKKSINPWNFTLTLSCSRILLKNEIKDSSLTMLPKERKSPQLKASFLELSADGKEITYLFDTRSQKKLCPGDFSMDGKYIIQSSHFSKKLSLIYQERLTNNTLAGFVLKQDGNPVKNAMLSLKTAHTTTQYNTDSHGYYLIKNVTNPLSLTISKEGFQTVTLKNPLLSAKGVSCENIILRSKQDTNLSLEFLVTDTEQIPIPDASVTIALDKSNTEEIENTSVCSDSLSKKDILLTNKTDSSGTLFLSNYDLIHHFPAPCSNFEINQKTKLSYMAAYQPSSSHYALLTEKELNTTNQYSIYVGTSDNCSVSYYTQKISFSFADLSTNHARFHVQLSKCPNLSISSLSLSYEKEFSSFSHDTISLRLFHPENRNPVYEYQINYHSFQKKEDEFFLSSLQLPISLFDGRYYLQIQIVSKDGDILLETPISPVIIQNASLTGIKLTLKSPRFARILTYANIENNTPEMASFQLYQKADEVYFWLETFSTDFFTSKDNTIFTAKLLLSHLIENETYLLVPVTDNIMAKNELTFTATSENTFSTKKEAVYSLLPLAQIFCEHNNNFSDSLCQTVTTTYSNFHNITSDFIRSSESYPNCVLAFYHTDGTLITATLTNKITKNTIPSDFSDNKSSIIDIYTNKETIITNQNSYLSSSM